MHVSETAYLTKLNTQTHTSTPHTDTPTGTSQQRDNCKFIWVQKKRKWNSIGLFLIVSLRVELSLLQFAFGLFCQLTGKCQKLHTHTHTHRAVTHTHIRAQRAGRILTHCGWMLSWIPSLRLADLSRLFISIFLIEQTCLHSCVCVRVGGGVGVAWERRYPCGQQALPCISLKL